MGVNEHWLLSALNHGCEHWFLSTLDYECDVTVLRACHLDVSAWMDFNLNQGTETNLSPLSHFAFSGVLYHMKLRHPGFHFQEHQVNKRIYLKFSYT